MSTLQGKLAALLKRIEGNTYDATQLTNMVLLQNKIQTDIGASDPAEAMALLGYLLKYEYVKLDSERGIILNESKIKDIEQIMKV